MTLTAANVKAYASSLGFVACGITDLAPTAHGAELDRWLARGYAGTMRYLHRQAAKRKTPQLFAPMAKRIVVVLDNYYYSTPPEAGPRIARYAQGQDYHISTRRRLAELADFLRQNGARMAGTHVDSDPVPERELAQRAGLGWIGKNTMLIHPGLGSFVFIGTVFTDLLLETDLPYEADRCGSCTRCLEACPTAAFPEPRVLDANRCISYLTIEYRGEIPEQFGDLGGWGFGCDICNDVCPWNQRFATESTIPGFRPREELQDAPPDYFDRMTEGEFRDRFGDTPFERPGLKGMRRNWRAAQGGAGRPAEPSS